MTKVSSAHTPSRDIAELLRIMTALRDPLTGCPWDIEQSFASIAPYTVEEAHEVVDAIMRGDMDDLREELGDLLLQVVFHAEMARQQGAFDFGGVVEAITTKMIRRHPHVFGQKRDWTPAEVKASWSRIKAEEKAERAARRGETGEGDARTLAGVSAALPAAQRAVKLQDKAAKVGFDWANVEDVLAKAEEELAELREAVASKSKSHVAEELGDLLFVLANVARWHGLDPDTALAGASIKFERRFGRVEDMLRERGRTPEQSNLQEMDALWNEAKKRG
jgi:nucleoside triphosphate diphosphatase